MFKKLSLFVIVFFVSLFFFGCSNKQSKNEIRVFAWEGLEFRNIFKTIVDEFEKDNPGIKVKAEFTYRGYANKLITLAASGTLPDIIEVNPDYAGYLVPKGVLQDLSEFEKEYPDTASDKFFDISVKNFFYDIKKNKFGEGNLYAVPKDWNPDYCIFYNKNLFDKAGISYPDSTWTWTDFVKAAQKLTVVKNNIVEQMGAYFNVTDALGFMMLLYQNGGKVWSPDYKKCLMDSKEAVETFSFIMDLMKKYKVVPNVTQSDQFGGANNDKSLFYMGKIGMMFSGKYEVSILQKKVGDKFRWGVSGIFHGPVRRANIMWGPAGWAVAENSKNKKLAYKFLNYLVGEKTQIAMAKLNWGVPSLKSVAFSQFFSNVKNKNMRKINNLFLAERKVTFQHPINPYISYQEFYSILNRELDNIIYDKKTVKQGLTDAVKAINELIAKNIKEIQQ